LLVHVRPPENPNGSEAAVYEEEGSASPGLYGSGQAAGSAPEGDEATVYEEGIFKLKVYPILASSGRRMATSRLPGPSGSVAAAGI
jgi:hypothetical protein